MAITITVPASPVMLNDGSNVDMTTDEAAAFREAIGAQGSSGTLGISSGGTGATTAAAARTNLGAASAEDLGDLEDQVNTLALSGMPAYPDEAAGEADTTDGQYFQVPGALGADLASTQYVNNSGTADELASFPSYSFVERVANADPKRAHIETVAGIVGEKLDALWYDEAGTTAYSGGPAITQWVTAGGQALTASLYGTLFSGADPRPIVADEGLYFNAEAGLTVSDGVITNTENFVLLYSFNLAVEDVTTYATDALRDAAVGSHVNGDVAYVNADTNTVFTPDVALPMDAGFADADLVNGYSKLNFTGAYQGDTTTMGILTFKGATDYIRIYVNHLGQIVCTVYDGTTAMNVRSNGTDFQALAGPHTLGLQLTNTHLRLWLDGVEMMAVDKSILGALSLDTMYFNGQGRTANNALPVGGWRHYVKALSVISEPTEIEFRSAHDAVSRYSGTPLLRRPAEMWGFITAGQSRWQGAIDSSSDTWTTPSGWDGHVDEESPGRSGSNQCVTRQHLPGVYISQSQTETADIGPPYIDLNSLGNINTASTHRKGDREGCINGVFAQWNAYPNAPEIDWVVSSAGAGGAGLTPTLNGLSTPVPLMASLKAMDPTSLTYLERLLQGVVNAKAFAASRGQAYSIKAFLWDQGETIPNDNGSYATNLIAYYDLFLYYARQITGQADLPVMLFPQANYSGDGTSNAYVQVSTFYRDQAFLDVVDQRGYRPMYCYGPVYQQSNFIHMYQLGQRWSGEIIGKFLCRILVDGEDGECLRPDTLTLGANYVDITFKGRHGALQFDTNDNNIDALLTNKGFEFTDTSGGGVTITGVSLITSNTVVRIALSGAPATGDVITYTGATCRYGNLCDSDTFQPIYEDQDWTAPFTSGSPKFALGNPNDMRNWCAAFREVL